MRHLPDLRTLGVTALVIGVAPFVAPTAARAQIQTYYHAGSWDAFSGRNDKGGAVCGVGNTNAADNRRLSIRMDIGGADTVFSVSKPGWSIPDGTRITVVMQIGLNTPWTEQATGHGHAITWPLDRGTMQPFDQQFRGASSMTVTFPDGNEPPWTVSLAGSSAISDTFGRCVRDLTQQVQAAQPPASAPPPPQGATQPFSATAGSPPADAPPPGPPPTATQPDATQPDGTQPTGTQPTGVSPPR